MHLKSIILGHIRPPSHHCHAILSHKGAMAFILPLLPEENHLGQSDQSYVLLKFWAWMETLQEPHLPIPMASLAWKPGKIPWLLPQVLTQDTVNNLHRWIFNEPQLQPFCILVSGNLLHHSCVMWTFWVVLASWCPWRWSVHLAGFGVLYILKTTELSRTSCFKLQATKFFETWVGLQVYTVLFIHVYT